MAHQLTATNKKAFEIANQLDDAADAIRDRSKHAFGEGGMSLEDYMDARAQEMELRSALQLILAKNLGLALSEAAEAEDGIEAAIARAKNRIQTVQSVKDGLKVVASLVELAVALGSGDLKRIAKAGKAVVDHG